MIFSFILILVLVGVALILIHKKEKSGIQQTTVKKTVPSKRLSLDERLQLEKADNISQLAHTVEQVRSETIQQLLTVLSNLEKAKR